MAKKSVKIDVYQFSDQFMARCEQFAILDTNWRSVSSVASHKIKVAEESVRNLQTALDRDSKRGDDKRVAEDTTALVKASEILEKYEAAFQELKESRVKFELDDADKAFAAAYAEAFDMNAKGAYPFDHDAMSKAFASWCGAHNVPYRKGSDLETFVFKAISGAKLAGTRTRVKSNNQTWIVSRKGVNFMSLVYGTCIQYALGKGVHVRTSEFSDECKALFTKKG